MLFGPGNKQSLRKLLQLSGRSLDCFIRIGTLELRHSLDLLGPTSYEPWRVVSLRPETLSGRNGNRNQVETASFKSLWHGKGNERAAKSPLEQAYGNLLRENRLPPDKILHIPTVQNTPCARTVQKKCLNPTPTNC